MKVYRAMDKDTGKVLHNFFNLPEYIDVSKMVEKTLKEKFKNINNIDNIIIKEDVLCDSNWDNIMMLKDRIEEIEKKLSK